MLDTRAKIVCTLGPSSSDEGTISRMIEAGMNVARLNFSHGNHEEHARTIETLRGASLKLGRPVGILLDLQGPKIRVGRFIGGHALLEPGSAFTITGREVEGNGDIVSSTHTGLARDVSPGDRILLDDGLITLKVLGTEGLDVRCEVVDGGVLKNNKGINIPEAVVSVETITEKDLTDAKFGVDQGVDFIAMSFVRHPDDIQAMRGHLAGWGAEGMPIISKIEKPQALDHIVAIISGSDAVMVARGDLGVEMSPEQVPGIQKRLIAECNRMGKAVITATQMLESMVTHPRPTRAEASDVANAILDGSDAVMLSAESASGKHPVETVEVMKRIIHATESTHRAHDPTRRRRSDGGELAVHEGIAITACTLAESVDAGAIASITLTGSMSRAIAKHRPAKAIFAVSQFEQVVRRLSVVWGVEGLLMPDLTMDIDEAVVEVKKQLVDSGRLVRGGSVVLTAGLPFAERKATNMVRVDVVE